MEDAWRKSILQYIQEKSTCNVCRLIFCAKIADCENVAETFEKRTKNFTQRITGLLFIYSDFIIHLIEGLEDDVLQLCREVFTINPETITNIKCLYMQSDAKKRFFDEWYYRRMNDSALKLNTLKNLTDNFENASNTYRRIVLNLCDLYTELWNISQLKNYENLTQRLDLIAVHGHHCIPSKEDIEFVVESSWGYDLANLVKDYCNLHYFSNFDDYSPVSEIIQEIDYNYNE